MGRRMSRVQRIWMRSMQRRRRRRRRMTVDFNEYFEKYFCINTKWCDKNVYSPFLSWQLHFWGRNKWKIRLVPSSLVHSLHIIIKIDHNHTKQLSPSKQKYHYKIITTIKIKIIADITETTWEWGRSRASRPPGSLKQVRNILNI